MKTILITGASRGIGRSIALAFAKLGYFVAINYNNSEEKAKALLNEIVSDGGNAGLYRADVSSYEQLCLMFENVIKDVGHIDVLVNNAGISTKGLLIEEKNEDTANVINTNLIGTINASKLAIRNMLNHGGGKIVNISSIWGNVGASMEATYSASKAGIICLTKSLAKEYGYNNIQVNCICPGVVDTDMNKTLSKEELLTLTEEIPAKRLCMPEEIAEVVKFLTQDTGYITGQVITIDGGFTL